MRFKQTSTKRALIVVALVAVSGLLVGNVAVSFQSEEPGGITPPNFKVAFVGDQDSNDDAESVIQLIKDQGAEFLVVLGDLDYNFRPDHWERQHDEILGPDFPIVAVVGNHDRVQWPNFYQPLFQARYDRMPDLHCEGDIGREEVCTYKGLYLVLSGAGTRGIDDYEPFIEESLQNDNSVWRVCAWHHNQTAMQLGTKANDVGWESYEICRREGAIIANGHEHSYQRTRNLIDMENQVIDPEFPEISPVRVAPGSTFVVVSGLGGREIRNQDRCEPFEFPYGCDGIWASAYTADQGATFGALFITFHVDDDPNKALGEFININGEVIDRFEIFSQMN
jgi:predicted phosphodiesterase